MDRFEKRGVCSSSQLFPNRNLRYRPEDRCNGCFRYSSDFRYKRQSLPPYSQRSTRLDGTVEILPASVYNRYKPQSLTGSAGSWREFDAWQEFDVPAELAGLSQTTEFTAASGVDLAWPDHRRQEKALPKPIYRYIRQGLRHGCSPNNRLNRYDTERFPKLPARWPGSAARPDATHQCKAADASLTVHHTIGRTPCAPGGRSPTRFIVRTSVETSQPRTNKARTR